MKLISPCVPISAGDCPGLSSLLFIFAMQRGKSDQSHDARLVLFRAFWGLVLAVNTEKLLFCPAAF